MDVSVWSEDGGWAVKLSAPEWEINLRAPADELARLEGIGSASWDERRSIQAGRSAGSLVFWAGSGSDVTAMIGQDDETWDIAVTMPVSVVDELVRTWRTEVRRPDGG